VYAIKALADENIDRNYKNRNIYILSDSQSAINALEPACGISVGFTKKAVMDRTSRNHK
jgi:hypothetical protein